jgi:UDP:flavonoid glycosyltransferase YjiC (YdhE family)
VRVLVASTGGAGHFGPLVPFIDALGRRGDEVLLVVAPELERTVASMGHAFRLTEEPPADEVDALWERFAKVSRSEGAILANREYFGRLCTTAMLPVAERACHQWRPDLVLHEAAEYASAVAAERRGIAHAQVGVSLAEVEAGSLDLAAPVLDRFCDRIVDRLLASPYLTRFPASVDPSPYPVTWRIRERAAEPSTPLPDWWDGSDKPLVYVTFGSVAGDFPIAVGAYRTALEAVADLEVRVLLTVGRQTDLAAIGPPPANAHVEAWVPQADILRTAAVVLAHGGSGTTFGALAAGVPLVLVPLFADQPVNAERVAATGAALVVAPDRGLADGIVALTRDDAPRLRAAIEAALSEPSYRRAASRIADEMRAYPSIDELLATLAAARGTAPN